MSETIWDAEETEGGVTVVLPDGSEEIVDKLTADGLREIVRDARIKKYTVEDEDGDMLGPGDFPVTEGQLTIKEHNEPK